MEKDSTAIETIFKIKELERLLSEGKITLEQYLDSRTKIESSYQHLSAKQTITIHPNNTQGLNFKKTKKPYNKMVPGLILCTIIIVGGFLAWDLLNRREKEETFGFMGTEQISFTGIYWPADLSHVNMTVKNTGTATLTIASIKINTLLNTTSPGWTCWSSNTVTSQTPNELRTLNANEKIVIKIDPSKYGITMHAGDNFAFLVITPKNNQFGPYTAQAPS